MGNPIYARSPNSRLYGYALSSVWNTGLWMPDPDWALAQDPDVWEVVQRDPVIAHALNQRFASVASIDPSVQPGGDTDPDIKAANAIETLFREILDWEEARFQSAKAIALGRTYQFVAGERRRLVVAGVEDDWWVPIGFSPIDRRRIQFVAVQTEDPETRDTHYSQRVQMQRKRDNQWIDLSDDALRRLVTVTYDDEESRLGYGRGILGAIYFGAWAKTAVWKEGLAGVQRWARGLPVATIKGDRLSSTTKSNAEQRQAWLDTLLNMSGQGGVVMEEGDELDVKWPNGEGINAVREVLDYIDRTVTQLILGAVLPTGGGADVGSNARAKQESESTQVLLQHDRRKLDNAYSRTLVDLVWHHNVPQLARIGCLLARKPTVRSVQESREDPRDVAETAKIILESGAPLKKAQYYERVGWEMPAEGEDVIKGRAAPEPSPFGGGGFPGGGGEPPPFGQPRDAPKDGSSEGFVRKTQELHGGGSVYEWQAGEPKKQRGEWRFSPPEIAVSEKP